MKTIRFGGEDGEMESATMANVLMLLSKGSNNAVVAVGEESDSSAGSAPATSAPGRVFECKTCNRRFPSFQALGGHRASHKKPRTGGGDGAAAAPRPRVHECSFCGLEFAIGQALGGHMRRHRATVPRVDVLGRQRLGTEEEEGKKSSSGGSADSDGRRRGLSLDLNLPPLMEEDVELRRIGLSLEIVDHNVSCVMDCLH